MRVLSTSFTLGKASTGDANLEHNNREFIADNIDVSRTIDNVCYVNQDVRAAYDELFGEALEKYNAKQTRRDRVIHDYYEHILEGRREEAYYEVIVQFGDSKIAPVGSDMGDIATKMLDKYMRGFGQRNPNLFVFCNNLHLDEASPHLHINFIPFYTQNGGRKNGLSKGVSMKSALDEQGFTAKNYKENRLVAWEDSEFKEMERILKQYGLSRDVKKATHKHMSLPEYKKSQDDKKHFDKSWQSVSSQEVTVENLSDLKRKVSLLNVEKDRLITEKNSPWRSFYYSDSSKQVFVQHKLDSLNIPYRESDNGFEAQQCYIDDIRKIEKQYKSEPTSKRGKLRVTIDKYIMLSRNLDEVLTKLETARCEVKRGKYLAIKPPDCSQFIRVRSLGDFYSEQALQNRINYNLQRESNLFNRAGENNILKEDISLELMTTKTMKQYIIIFKQGYLPMRKINKKKPFSWENCAELDRLASLNKKINEGLTLESLWNDFVKLEKSIEEKEKRIDEIKSELGSKNSLYELAVNWYRHNIRNPGDYEVLQMHELTIDKYNRLCGEVENLEKQIADIEKSISDERMGFKETSDTLTLLEKVANGTHVQSLVYEEKQRLQVDLVGNGFKLAGGSNSARVETISRKIDETEEAESVVVTEQKQPYKPKTR